MAEQQYTVTTDLVGLAHSLFRGVTQSDHAIAKGQRERRLLREQREAEQRQQREAAK